jgi:hypothetical protein
LTFDFFDVIVSKWLSICYLFGITGLKWLMQGGNMLIEYRPFYQFTMFLFTGVIGTPEWVNKFAPAFGKLDMMPSLVPHPNIYLGLGEQPANLQQLNFVTAQKDVVVIFDTDRYVVQMQLIPAKKLPPIEDFIAKIEEIANIINGIVEGKAIRLGFVTTGICKQMEDVKLNEIHQSLFKFPSFFNTNDFVEWNSRHVYRIPKDINDKSELLNVILNINRIQMTHSFEHKPVPFDGIEIGMDINTYQGNSSQRFSIEDVKHFLNEAINIKTGLESSLQEIIKD